jgi:hypothetical protein
MRCQVANFAGISDHGNRVNRGRAETLCDGRRQVAHASPILQHGVSQRLRPHRDVEDTPLPTSMSCGMSFQMRPHASRNRRRAPVHPIALDFWLLTVQGSQMVGQSCDLPHDVMRMGDGAMPFLAVECRSESPSWHASWQTGSRNAETV